MFIAPQVLVGKRVLIVEDELIVAMVIEDFLLECGCVPVGPCASVAQALNAVRTEGLDVAVLDVNLDGEMVYPVARALTERRIPFLFMSGYGQEAIESGQSDQFVCAKPFAGGELVAKLAAMLEGAGPALHAEDQPASA
jgi:DNA-binding response OmpR family regulator